MEGVLKEGDMVKVKLIGLDQKTGKFKLSRKVLMPKPEGAGASPKAPAGGRPEEQYIHFLRQIPVCGLAPQTRNATSVSRTDIR